MSALRPLPSRPSLEYEHKEAKALLRRLRAGDPDSLARARERHPTIDVSPPARIRLADAQLVVAREHGFASWPRLVRWFGDVERQRHGHWQLHAGRGLYEAYVRDLLAEHRTRSSAPGRALAAYVPRFYGLSLDEVFASAVSEDDARLAVARAHGAPSWEVLLERLAATAATRPDDWQADPFGLAVAAMDDADLGALERVVAAHPELLHPSEYDEATGHTLMHMALGQERRRGAYAMQPIMLWLAAHGFDRQRELGIRLCGHVGMTPEEVHDLLDLGADPDWVAPNGLPVLEHALLRYWNGDAVDVLAARTTPRRALWIAAGLGDVNGVRAFLDRHHMPTPAARQLRPDFVAVGRAGFMTPLPDADDEEILVEALLVAMLNGRTAVLEYLAARGAPLNSLVYGAPLITMAVGNAMTAEVECLVRCGADLDLRSERADNKSARELARELFEQRPQDAVLRRIVELCGMNADVVLAERDARPMSPPRVGPALANALELARDDAARLGQPDVRLENLLVGLLRGGGPPLLFLKEAGRLDVGRLRDERGDRVAPSGDVARRPELPMHPDADAALKAATVFAIERRAESVDGLHLLHALTRSGGGPVAELLARYGASAVTVNAELTKGL